MNKPVKKVNEHNGSVVKSCGLVMPISASENYTADHWVEVRQIVTESLKETEYNVSLVSESDDSGVIHRRIVNNLYDMDIVICDVSGKNPNVMFELGMRLAFDKPTIIIKDDNTNYSFDTAPIEHLEYQADLHYPSIIKFKEHLRKKVEVTYKNSRKTGYTTFLGHFGEFRVAKIEEKEVSGQEYLLSTVKSLANTVSRMDHKITNMVEEKEKSERNRRILIEQMTNSKERHNDFLFSSNETNHSNITEMDDEIPF